MQTLIKMIRVKFKELSMILLFLSFLPAGIAQKQTKVWDLKACIEYAKKNNIQINTLRLTASSDKQDLSLSKNARYPGLNASVSQNVSYNNSDFQNSTNYGVNSSVVLFKGNYYNNDIKASKLSLEAANLDVTSAENDITLQITQAYLNILLAGENIEYVKDLVTTSESQVEQCKEKLKSGTVALKDLMQLESTFATDKYTLVAAENTRRQNILSLKTLLQLPADSSFEITAPENANTEISIASLDSVRKVALQIMPQVKSSDILVNKQSVEVAMAKAGYFPTLSMDGSLSMSAMSNQYNSYFIQESNQITPQIGLTLSIPIYNKKANSIAVAKSKISLEQAKLSSENVKTNLMQTIEQAYINVKNAQSQFNAAKEQLDYAKESYRISSEELKIGSNNNVEYLQQKNLYVQALQQYVQAKYSMLLYIKIYNFYKGTPVTA
ncbi:MAG: TolC family protein [Bacteroidota bacterium]|nr:TolC family protein [Bacteroidota bacterium]